MENQLQLLSSRRFLPLLLTHFFGALNDNLFKGALVTAIAYGVMTHASARIQVMAILATAVSILPALFFSAWAGQLADKIVRSKLIFRIKLIEVLVTALALYAIALQSLSLSIVVLLLLSTTVAFFSPIKFAILPDHLNEKELIQGNSLLEASNFIAILVGAILGCLFVSLSAERFLLSSFMILSSFAGLIASRFILPSPAAAKEVQLKWNFLNESATLMKQATQHWDMYLIILGIAWFWLIGGAFLAGFSTYVKDVLGASTDLMGLLFVIFFAGIAAGSLSCNKLRLLKGQIHATYVPFAVLTMGFFIFDLYFLSRHAVPIKWTDYSSFLKDSHHIRVVFDLFCIAVCAGLYTVPLTALLQKRAEKTQRARIIAGSNIISAAAMFLSLAITMMMTVIGFSVSYIFLLLAITNVFVAIYVCKLLPDAVLKSFVRWLLTLLYRVEIRGVENYFAAGDRVMIIANHTSFLDGALLAAFLPEKVTFAVNTNAAKQWWIRLFLTMVDSYLLDPLNPLAAKSLIEFMRKGKKCAIFPEGRITVTGALMKVYEGPALIADKAGATILPLSIEGAQYSPFSRLKGKLDIKWFPKITLTIFPPQQFSLKEKGRQRRQKMGYFLYDLMTEMVFRSRQPNHTLFHSLLAAKNSHGRGHIIVEDIERKPLSYQKFITRCFILGKFLSKKTEQNEHIGILLPNSITTAVMFFGLHAYSRIPAMLNYSTGVKNLRVACQLAQIKQVYTSRKFVEKGNLFSLIEAIEKENIKIIFLEDLRNKITFFRKLHGLIVSQCPRFYYEKIIHRHHTLNPNKPAVVLFTSGSEGVPKGVVLSHANLQANRLQIGVKVDFTPVDTAFNAMPVFHSFGLTAGLILPLLSGIRVFFYPSPLHYRIVPELVYDTNATLLFGTDTFLSNYAKYAHPYDFYSLRYIFAGAEKLKEETRAMWSEKFGKRLFEGYGITETSPVLAANTPMHNRTNTVGRLMTGIDYKLKEIPGIKEGKELVVSGPNIMMGYLKLEKPGEIVAPEGGWYETGDIVSIDAEGYITIQGRAKRFAKIAGEMVSLSSIENYVIQLWPYKHHAAVNLPDAKKGEVIVLVTDELNANREDLIAYARKMGIAEIAIPKKIIITEAFPILASGKIDYVSAKELAITLLQNEPETEEELEYDEV